MGLDFDELKKIQKIMQERAVKEVEQDRTIELISMVNSMIADGRKVQTERVYFLALDRGFTEAQVNEVIDKLIKDRIIYQPKVGYIQREG